MAVYAIPKVMRVTILLDNNIFNTYILLYITQTFTQNCF